MEWRTSALCILLLALTCGTLVNAKRVYASNHVNTICSMWGNFHFTTFDGETYQFKGTCEYNLVSDCHSLIRQFSVYVKRTQEPKDSKISRLSVTINDIAVVMTEDLVTVNEQNVTLPIHVSGILVEKNAIYTKLYSKIGISVMWNRDDSVLVELDSKYSGHTCGLCGDFNGIALNDEFIHSGRKLGYVEFGNMHRVHDPSHYCEDPFEEVEEQNAVGRCEEHEICGDILENKDWSSCSWVLSPLPYIKACANDVCNRQPGETNTTSLCSTLSEYSRQCSHAGGTPPNWRKSNFCSVKCPYNMVYSESGSPCMDTCSHRDTNTLCEEHKVDGCFCPPGTVFDDISNTGCIPLKQCQCKHDHVYNAGEVLQQEGEECVCDGGNWICKSLPSPGLCAVEEGSHFTTYDGKEFTFHGDCNYLLSKDCEGSKFIILGKIVPCINLETDTCLKSIVVLIDNDKKNPLIIKADGTVQHNAEVLLPYTTADFTVFRPSSFHIMFQTAFGLQVQVQLVPLMQVYITVDQSFQGKTCGLCGNFNKVLSDDLKTPQGMVEGTATSFANAWKVQSNCPDRKERMDDPCSYSTNSEHFAEHWCSKMKDKESLFAKCHASVNPDSYYKRCKYSSCSCEKSEECLCAVFSSYARACAAKGIFLQGWRHLVCEKYTENCPASQNYSYQLQSCQSTCQSLSSERQDCSDDFVPVDGCACPKGLYQDEKGVCVPMEKCPCYNNGLKVQPGRSVSIKDEHCVCMNGKLHCRSWKPRFLDCSSPKVYFNCSTAGQNENGLECAQTCLQQNVDCFSLECESGCQCPTGLLDDGRGNCVTPHNCPCSHNGQFYAPGAQITMDCNKCTCQHGTWKCTEHSCPGICTIYGSGHYQTFDEQRFGFRGDCSYIAVQDKCGNKTGQFSVVTENIPCGTTGTTCSKAVDIFLGRTRLDLSDDKVTATDTGVGPLIKYNERKVGMYIVIDAENGLTVLWDRITTVRIILQPQHSGQVCGLCGNFNGDGKDDFTTQGNLQTTNVLEFVDSWKAASNCPDSEMDIDPCMATPNRHTWAKIQCSIIKEDTFKDCHSKVDPNPYYENCVKDSCACDTGGDCECFCTAVAAYAQACNEADVCVVWRTPEICPVYCDYYNNPGDCTWHYSPCHTPCYKTCLNPEGICNNTLPNLEGCYPKCPEDKPIFDEKNQICVEACNGTCYINGTEFNPGEEIPTEEPCQICICDENGKIQCFQKPGCCYYNGTEYGDNEIIYNVTDGMGMCYYAICINTTVIETQEPCKPSPPPPESTPTTTITVSTTESTTPSQPPTVSTSSPTPTEITTTTTPPSSTPTTKMTQSTTMEGSTTSSQTPKPPTVSTSSPTPTEITTTTTTTPPSSTPTTKMTQSTTMEGSTTSSQTPTPPTVSTSSPTPTEITTTTTPPSSTPTTKMTQSTTMEGSTTSSQTPTPPTVSTSSPTPTEITTTTTTPPSSTPTTKMTQSTTMEGSTTSSQTPKPPTVSTSSPTPTEITTTTTTTPPSSTPTTKMTQSTTMEGSTTSSQTPKPPTVSTSSPTPTEITTTTTTTTPPSSTPTTKMTQSTTMEGSTTSSQTPKPPTVSTSSPTPTEITTTTTTTTPPSSTPTTKMTQSTTMEGSTTSSQTPKPPTVSTSSPTPTKITTTSSGTPETMSPCVDICEWSEWFNVYNPATGGDNDLETYKNIKESGKKICEHPEDIECRAVNKPDMSFEEYVNSSKQVVQCNVSYGLQCEKKNQNARPYKCFDYEIRVLCCFPCSTPSPATTPTSTFSTTQTPLSSTSIPSTTSSQPPKPPTVSTSSPTPTEIPTTTTKTPPSSTPTTKMTQSTTMVGSTTFSQTPTPPTVSTSSPTPTKITTTTGTPPGSTPTTEKVITLSVSTKSSSTSGLPITTGPIKTTLPPSTGGQITGSTTTKPTPTERTTTTQTPPGSTPTTEVTQSTTVVVSTTSPQTPKPPTVSTTSPTPTKTTTGIPTGSTTTTKLTQSTTGFESTTSSQTPKPPTVSTSPTPTERTTTTQTPPGSTPTTEVTQSTTVSTTSPQTPKPPTVFTTSPTPTKTTTGIPTGSTTTTKLTQSTTGVGSTTSSQTPKPPTVSTSPTPTERTTTTQTPPGSTPTAEVTESTTLSTTSPQTPKPPTVSTTPPTPTKTTTGIPTGSTTTTKLTQSTTGFESTTSSQTPKPPTVSTSPTPTERTTTTQTPPGSTPTTEVTQSTTVSTTSPQTPKPPTVSTTPPTPTKTTTGIPTGSTTTTKLTQSTTGFESTTSSQTPKPPTVSTSPTPTERTTTTQTPPGSTPTAEVTESTTLSTTSPQTPRPLTVSTTPPTPTKTTTGIPTGSTTTTKLTQSTTGFESTTSSQTPKPPTVSTSPTPTERTTTTQTPPGSTPTTEVTQSTTVSTTSPQTPKPPTVSTTPPTPTKTTTGIPTGSTTTTKLTQSTTGFESTTSSQTPKPPTVSTSPTPTERTTTTQTPPGSTPTTEVTQSTTVSTTSPQTPRPPTVSTTSPTPTKTTTGIPTGSTTTTKLTQSTTGVGSTTSSQTPKPPTVSTSPTPTERTTTTQTPPGSTPTTEVTQSTTVSTTSPQTPKPPTVSTTSPTPTIITTTTTTTGTPTVSSTRPGSTTPTASTKPLTTTIKTTLSTTTRPSTTLCFCEFNGTQYEPGETILDNVHLGSGICLTMVCSDICVIQNTTNPCPTSPTPTPTPYYDCPEWDKNTNETFILCNCTMARCIEDNIIEIIPYECPPLQNITCANGKNPVLVYDEHYCCQHYACDCFCEGWGDPHYITFDGTFYSYQGNCTYTLMEEIRPHYHLKIYIDNVYCDPIEHVSCPRSIIVSYNNLIITLTNHNLFGGAELEASINNEKLRLPFSRNAVRVVSSSLDLFLEIPQLGVIVTFGATGFSINLPFQHFGNNTQGHCGTCNNNRADDCMLPGGILVSDCAVMADYWPANLKNGEICTKPTVLPTVGTSPKPTPSNCQALPECNLLHSKLFEQCHHYVSPDNFFLGCHYDSCHMSNPAVVCTSLQTYARTCSQFGLCINWRNYTSLCNIECPTNKIFKPCGPAEPQTCEDQPEERSLEIPTEGCFCPDGMMLFNKVSDVCVEKCGCLDASETPREFGEVFEYNCEVCVCERATKSINCKPKQCLDSVPESCTLPGLVLVNVTDPSDPCCTKQVCNCDTSTCPSLKNVCEIGYSSELEVPEGKCCPEIICVPKKVCVFDNKEYEPGSPIPVVNCQECTCTREVDPKTQLFKISCKMVTCNKVCNLGYEYQEPVSYKDCCGKCVQTHCIINVNGTQHILKEGEVLPTTDRDCDRITCTKVNGQFITDNYRVQCPAFNISNCQHGTVQLMADGCCYFCVDKIKGCQVQVVQDYIVHDGCQSENKIDLTFCEGDCGSYSRYTEPKLSACSCCQATNISNRTVSLGCPSGAKIHHTYIQVNECTCSKTACHETGFNQHKLENSRKKRDFQLT
ncbi:uncharacterized protein muc2.1 isoform X2 [Misgurnus anguillicaudatus]|uniref:uncharacterized protein muc2.1 isoform X2 n=1 Tax=Misgurnus anguillicaudatus TaxID=75329 RepID=UPI003CCF0470